jgi:hypothetical protein
VLGRVELQVGLQHGPPHLRRLAHLHRDEARQGHLHDDLVRHDFSRRVHATHLVVVLLHRQLREARAVVQQPLLEDLYLPRVVRVLRAAVARLELGAVRILVETRGTGGRGKH